MSQPRTIPEVIAQRIRSQRKALGWSVKTLAEECARLGAPQLTEPSLVNIERGQHEGAVRKGRDVTVEELVILGLALDYPPLMLVVPPDDEPIAITETTTVEPLELLDIITGAGWRSPEQRVCAAQGHQWKPLRYATWVPAYMRSPSELTGNYRCARCDILTQGRP